VFEHLHVYSDSHCNKPTIMAIQKQRLKFSLLGSFSRRSESEARVINIPLGRGGTYKFRNGTGFSYAQDETGGKANSVKSVTS